MLRAARAALLSISLGLVVAVVPAIGCGANESRSQTPREFDATGTIRAIELATHSVTIAHADVPGYMPAMTMPFELTSDAQVSSLSVGDPVSFRFRAAGGGRHVIVSVRRR